MSDKLKVLFLCTGNSCRSQMAEGWARHLKGDVIEAYSAGVIAVGVNETAARVMAEMAVDISAQYSKEVLEVMHVDPDVVITLCGNADENCPVFPDKTKVVHIGFDDPPSLAADAKTEEDAIAPFRRVRDEIKAMVETLPERLLSEN